MPRTDVIIVGDGQAGLAMSRSFTLRGVDHVVLERGRIGERWHSERWRSLHLLTTNAMSALPGLPHNGRDPDAFMPAQDFASYLERYARAIASPVINGAQVIRVEPDAGGYRVATTAGVWLSRALVVATGACETPFRPAAAEALAPSIVQVCPTKYWEPDELPEGGVLVIGASATGLQLAEDSPFRAACDLRSAITRACRAVTEGGNVYAWMETAGILDDPALEGGNLDAARRQPSLQLVGRPDNRDLDLGVLSRLGIRLVGRLEAIDGAKAAFAGDLDRTTRASHTRMLRILERIDGCIGDRRLEAPDPDPATRISFLAAGEPVTLHLACEGVRSVVWATGYVRRYPWLKAPALDDRGEILHRGGVATYPGLYVIGLTFLRRRRSSFIHGCGLDAEDLAPVIQAYLDGWSKKAA